MIAITILFGNPYDIRTCSILPLLIEFNAFEEFTKSSEDFGPGTFLNCVLI